MLFPGYQFIFLGYHNAILRTSIVGGTDHISGVSKYFLVESLSSFGVITVPGDQIIFLG